MTFKALVVEKDDEGKTSSSIQELTEDRLPEGDVLVNVEFSTLNYKDGLCLGSGGGLVRNYPHVPGIDFSGVVSSSASSNFAIGDRVVLTGWRVGEARWGGYAQKARVKSEWLVKLPAAMDCREAMSIGTAGFTSMLAIMELERNGLDPKNGPVLVTGAAGGVGSVATILLSRAGYEVTAVTGRPEAANYLKSLGAQSIVPREDLAETTKRPLEKETWAGCVDAVGGAMLARVLGQMRYGCSVAAVGLAGGANLPATVIPFLLRGVKLLGIDSVMCPLETRIAAWKRIAELMPKESFESITRTVALGEVGPLGKDILRGKVKGRIVVDVNA